MSPPVLVLPGVLDAGACQRIRLAMDAGAPEPAGVLADAIVHDETQRRALHIDVDQDTLAFVEATLDAARPAIAARLRVQLGEREGASLLRYTTGGFYGPHRDCGENAAWPDAIRRRISVVVFLTSSREADAVGGTFSGGTLRLYNGERGAFIDVAPRAGTLVAFPSMLLHEVTPVHEGTRDAIVDWFY